MGEEFHEHLISKLFPDNNLVPSSVYHAPESTWENDKDNMEGNGFYSLVDWDRTSVKPLNCQMTRTVIA